MGMGAALGLTGALSNEAAVRLLQVARALSAIPSAGRAATIWSDLSPAADLQQVFNVGAVRANVAKSQAAKEQALLGYMQSIHQGVADVSDALILTAIVAVLLVGSLKRNRPTEGGDYEYRDPPGHSP
jgi:hypothetical protein